MMPPINLPFFEQPLAWVFAKKRPTHFASRKNAPGIDYSKPEPQYVNPAEEPATTPGPEEVNGGDFAEASSRSVTPGKLETPVLVIDSPNPLQQAVLDYLEKGQLEVQELPKPE